jgi:uncharacterized cupredoxin-like copper-binding protein
MLARSLAVATAVAALALLLVVPAAPAATGSAKATTISVTMKEFKFTLSKSSVPAGAVLFKITNKGAVPHDFKIAGKKSALVAAGKSAVLAVTLKKGSQAYMCTVPGHAAAGMKGTLKVS